MHVIYLMIVHVKNDVIITSSHHYKNCRNSRINQFFNLWHRLSEY